MEIHEYYIRHVKIRYFEILVFSSLYYSFFLGIEIVMKSSFLHLDKGKNENNT